MPPPPPPPASPPPDNDELISDIVDRLVDDYHRDPRTHHIGASFLPSRAKTIAVIELLRRITFPGFFDDTRVTEANLHSHVTGLVAELRDLLHDQVNQALRYEVNAEHGDGRGDDCDACEQRAGELTATFLGGLSETRRRISLDVQATFEGDPAAQSTDENIFSYPGIDAIFIHRYAHELWKLKVPLIPRIMSEVVHNETGIDIHPGATIGDHFCIDHGTGIVIGETAILGNHVKLYQGVTLGALSLRGGHDRWEGVKRHPTIEDHVTIYGNAIILGGQTVIGEHATIGGSVFITASIPAHHTVTLDRDNLKIRPPKSKAKV